MTERPRDWDRELADIDKVLEKQESVPAGPAPRPGPAALPRAAVPARGSVAVTWLWVLFAVALAVALPLWPYQRACGLQAFVFLGAAAVTVVVGILAALSSWANRRGFAHLIALLVVAWGAIVAAREILPRTGYAREVRTWSCSVPAATTPAAAPVPGGQAAPAPQGQAVPAPAPEGRPDSVPVSR